MQDVASSLPQGAQGPAVNDEFDDTFGTLYGFTAEGYTPRELRDRLEDPPRSDVAEGYRQDHAIR